MNNRIIMSKLHVSRRVTSSVESPLRKFLPFAEHAEKEGVSVYYLNIGQPDLPAPVSFLRAVRSFSSNVISYVRSQGAPESQKAWSDYYKAHGIAYNPEDIIITTSGSESFFFAFLATCDPGDELLVFEPFYSNYKSVAAVLNVKLVPVLCDVKKGFPLPSRGSIESKITLKTRGILVTNPCNPTGAVYSRKELSLVASIAKRHNLWVITDETYREIVFRGKSAISMMHFPVVRDRVIMVDSVSKRFSLCGARIGCIASKDRELMKNILKLAQARLSSPEIEQKAIVPVFRDWRRITGAARLEYKKRRDVVWKALREMPGVVCGKPDGALYIVAKYPIDNADKFTKWMLTDFRYKNQTIMLTPAEDFYMTQGKGKDEMRIAYVLKVPKLRRAMEVLAHALEEYPGRV